jgi:hypothetical protein
VTLRPSRTSHSAPVGQRNPRPPNGPHPARTG